MTVATKKPAAQAEAPVVPQATTQAKTQAKAQTQPQQPTVVQAEMNDGALQIPEQDVQATQPAGQKHGTKAASTAAEAALRGEEARFAGRCGCMPVGSMPNNWAVEIGDFKTRSSANAVIAKLKAGDQAKLAGKDPKTFQVKRNGTKLFRLLVSGYDELSAKQSCARVAMMGKDCAVLSPNG